MIVDVYGNAGGKTVLHRLAYGDDGIVLAEIIGCDKCAFTSAIAEMSDFYALMLQYFTGVQHLLRSVVGDNQHM